VGLATERRDIRVCFIGDSYVAGIGDSEHRGWVGRVATFAHVIGLPVTVYNLGVWRDTSADVRNRWREEVRVRRAEGTEDRLVLSFGVDDASARGTTGRRPTRVDPDKSVGNLVAILNAAGEAGIPTLMVGPPAVADEAHNDRTSLLDERFAAACAARSVPYVPVLEQLRADRVWRSDVATEDGTHPGAKGYDRLARLVAGPWCGWLATPGGDQSVL
jgi:acyl-CoA thioesterase-1